MDPMRSKDREANPRIHRQHSRVLARVRPDHLGDGRVARAHLAQERRLQAFREPTAAPLAANTGEELPSALRDARVPDGTRPR